MSFFWILFISLFQMAQIGISSALGSFKGAFPYLDVASIQLLATLPDIIIMAVTILAGILLKRFRIKSFFVISTILFATASVMGALFHDSYLILLLSSSLIGAAIGCLMPAVNIWINENCKDEDKEKKFGFQSSAVTFGGVILSISCSFVSTVRWYYFYWIFLIVLIALPRFLTIKDKAQRAEGIKDHHSYRKKDIVLIAFFSLYTAFFFSLYNVIAVNISFYLEEHAVKSISAGVAIAVTLIGGSISGVFLKKLKTIFGDYLTAFSILLMGVGLLMLALTNSVFVVLPALFISGCSLSVVMAETTNLLVTTLESAATNIGVSVMLASSDGGGFVTSIYTKLTEMVFGFYTGNYVFLLTSLITIAFSLILIGGRFYYRKRCKNSPD